MALPTLHFIGIFHTLLNDDHSHCAFSGKARRFPKMMKPFGYRTVMYANTGSLTDADEQVDMMTAEEFDRYYPKQKPSDFHGDYAKFGTPAWAIFDGRLRVELAKRLQPGDLILHPFGHAHRDLIRAFPQYQHTETGIGYVDAPFGAWRIYESSAWLHWHLGRYEKEFSQDRGMVKAYSFVVPNYFDLADWPVCPPEQNLDYVLFLGRITESKGTRIIAEIIRALAEQKKKTKFIFAGQGDFQKEILDVVMRDPKLDSTYLDIEYRGPVTGIARAALVGRARCCILASQFIEPFAGSVVEGMLTGTPAIGPDFGAFRETIIEGITGYRCITLGDWLEAIEAAKTMNRGVVASITRSRYSLEKCGQKYHEIFQVLSDQYGAGWNTKHSYRIPGDRLLPIEYGTIGISGVAEGYPHLFNPDVEVSWPKTPLLPFPPPDSPESPL